jgi:hypothetical protein
VWREALIGLFADAIQPQQFLTIVESQTSLETSRYFALEAPLQAFRCETYFYLGLREAVTGDPNTRRRRAAAAFQNAVESGYTTYYEYHLARILLARYREPVVAATAARSSSSPRD